MSKADIMAIAKSIVPKTSDNTTTIVFKDGKTQPAIGNWTAYKNVWLVIQGKAEVTSLYQQLLLSYNEIYGLTF